VLSLEVTSCVVALVNALETFVELLVRAETFGGPSLTEGCVGPKLTIMTTLVQTCAGGFNSGGQRDYTEFTISSHARLSRAGHANWSSPCGLDGSGSVDYTDFTTFSSVWPVLCP
jgi:hypothetical protein